MEADGLEGTFDEDARLLHPSPWNLGIGKRYEKTEDHFFCGDDNLVLCINSWL